MDTARAPSSEVPVESNSKPSGYGALAGSVLRQTSSQAPLSVIVGMTPRT